ncbi:MAG: hypothetical protein R2716_02465 [Microthrixaceae bacterium]
MSGQTGDAGGGETRHTLREVPGFDLAMAEAIGAARQAGGAGDVPIGACVLQMLPGSEPRVVAVAGNERERRRTPPRMPSCSHSDPQRRTSGAGASTTASWW